MAFLSFFYVLFIGIPLELLYFLCCWPRLIFRCSCSYDPELGITSGCNAIEHTGNSETSPATEAVGIIAVGIPTSDIPNPLTAPRSSHIEEEMVVEEDIEAAMEKMKKVRWSSKLEAIKEEDEEEEIRSSNGRKEWEAKNMSSIDF